MVRVFVEQHSPAGPRLITVLLPTVATAPKPRKKATRVLKTDILPTHARSSAALATPDEPLA